MSTESTIVGGDRLEKQVIVDRVGNSIRLRRRGVPGPGKVLIPIDDVEDVAAVMQAYSE